ncbi:MAG TPA: phasin family protein [Azospirillaceae bacterium]|nr:phasin family protein [Azospirillaceae bacterium]
MASNTPDNRNQGQGTGNRSDSPRDGQPEVRREGPDRPQAGLGAESRGDRREGDTPNESTRRAIDTAVSEVAATGRQAADAGMRIARSATDAGQEVNRTAADMTTGFVNNVSEQMRRVVDIGSPEVRDTIERASRDLRVVARCGSVMAERSQPIVQEMLSFTQKATQTQLDAFNKLSRARSPLDVFAAHSEMVRTEMELWLQSGRRLGELMLQLGEQAEQMIQEENRDGGRQDQQTRRERTPA